MTSVISPENKRNGRRPKSALGRKMTISQIAAIAIFVIMLLLLIFEKSERHKITMVCGAITLVLVFIICLGEWETVWEILGLETFFETGFWYSSGRVETAVGINWETVCFIAGMLIMIEGVAECGFFRWLCLIIAKLVDYRPDAIFVIYMLLSAVLSMFIDAISVIMFLAIVTVELASIIKINPVPMILAEIFCANLGGCATSCGDPLNLIIATSYGYTFADFLRNTGIVTALCLAVIVPYFYLLIGRRLKAGTEIDLACFPTPSSAIKDKRSFGISVTIFLTAVVLLVTHVATGLTVASIGIFAALLTLAFAGKKAGAMLKKIHWSTILFFIGMFVVVSGVEHTGVLELLADFIRDVSGGNVAIILVIIICCSALASAFVDNAPFAAAMIPVISSLGSIPEVDISTLAWALSMGTGIGGTATPIGASGNDAGIAVASKNGHSIGWGKYCAIQVPATAIALVITTFFMELYY